MPTMVLNTESAVTARFQTYRRARFMRTRRDSRSAGALATPESSGGGGVWSGFAAILMSPRWTAAGHCPDQPPGDRVHNNGNQKQCKTYLNQRAEIHVSGRLGKLIGYHAGERVARREEAFGNLSMIAYDHRHGHGFTERAA